MLATHSTSMALIWSVHCAHMMGGGWRKRHDSVQFAIEQVAVAMGIDVDCEVFNLFADLFCASDKSTIDGGGYRARQGLVPDFCSPRLSDQCPRTLAELKGITD